MCPQRAVARLQGSPIAMSSTDVAVAPEAAGNNGASNYPRGSPLACWRSGKLLYSVLKALATLGEDWTLEMSQDLQVPT